MSESPLSEVESEYEVAVIGGGIVGAGVFRDLALHGVKTLLVEKGDFSGQTSRSSSKMLHGGIRYLENFDFQLVWEALQEKNLWLKLAPHLATEERFYLPVYKDSKRPLWMIRIGLLLYDILSSFKNTPHSSANAEQTLKALPGLNSKNLKGAGIYSDAIVDDLKLTLEVIYDALKEPGQKACNHVSLKGFTHRGEKCELTLIDNLTGKEKTVWAKDVVFATGPFTDRLLTDLGLNWKPRLLPSKGSHLWIKKSALPVNSPIVITTKDDRVIFVIPHKERVLVGTTEEKIEEDFYDIRPSQKEIDYLIRNLKRYFPEFQQKGSILSSFAGIRPLVADEDSSDPGKTSREHKTFRPHRNVYVLVGGKYTTFRVMAQDVTKEITLKHQKVYNSLKSLWPLRQRSHFYKEGDVAQLEDIQAVAENLVDKELVRTQEDFLNRCLPWDEHSDIYKQLKEWLATDNELNLPSTHQR